MDFSDPMWNDALTYTASEDRTFIGAALPHGGVIGPDDFKCSQRALGANQSVDIAVGRAVVRESVATNPLGWRAYLVNGANTIHNLPLAAPPATNNRYDIVFLKVNDSTITGVLNNWVLDKVEGVSGAGTPAEPALPNQSIPLARIWRTAGQASILTADITDYRTVVSTRTRMVSEQTHQSGDVFVGAGAHTIIISKTFTAIKGQRYRVSFEGNYVFQTGNRAICYIRHKAGSSIAVTDANAGNREFLNHGPEDTNAYDLVRTFVATADGNYTVGVSCFFYNGSASLIWDGDANAHLYLRIEEC